MISKTACVNNKMYFWLLNHNFALYVLALNLIYVSMRWMDKTKYSWGLKTMLQKYIIYRPRVAVINTAR